MTVDWLLLENLPRKRSMQEDICPQENFPVKKQKIEHETNHIGAYQSWKKSAFCSKKKALFAKIKSASGRKKRFFAQKKKLLMRRFLLFAFFTAYVKYIYHG